MRHVLERVNEEFQNVYILIRATSFMQHKQTFDRLTRKSVCDLSRRLESNQNGTVAFAPAAFSWIMSPKRPS